MAWVTLSICRPILKQTERGIMDQARHGRSGKPILKSFKKSFIIPLNLLVKRRRKKILLSVSLKSLIT